MEVVYYKILKIDNEAGQASFASFGKPPIQRKVG